MTNPTIINTLMETGKAALAQYEYNININIPQGIDIGTTPVQNALEVALISTLSHLVSWDISEARRLAADLLEDVNDHAGAAAVLAMD